MGRCLYQVLAIILVGLNFNGNEAKGKPYCDRVRDEDCLSLARNICLAIFGVLLFIIGLHAITRYCNTEMDYGSPTSIVARPMQPNVGVGRMQPNTGVRSNFSQPGSTFYPSAPAPASGVPVSTQVLYNPGLPKSNFIRGSESPPSYSEVMLENTDTNK